VGVVYFIWLIYTSLGFAVVGIATLACIPRLRVSFVNVVLFIPGALLGMVGFAKLLFGSIAKIAGAPAVDKMVQSVHYLPFAVFLVGGILGGTSVVALKTFLANKLEHL
jgi:hypothetical protein